MFNFLDFLTNISNIQWGSAWKFLVTVIAILILYWLFSFLIKILKHFLLKKAKRKREYSNIEIFSRAIKYLLLVVLIIFAVLSYGKSLAGFGLFAGLLTAALGWALQRPITGIAVWVMVVVQRPFEIGDRIIIGNVKGDVADITLTHIHLKEIGGTVASEEASGRVILIPNAKLLEENVINYTKQDDFILDEVKFTMTYESDIDKAQDVAKESAKTVLKSYIGTKGVKETYARTYFQPSGIDILVRYFAPASFRNEISSKVTQKIFKKVKRLKRLEFAYPHTEVLLRRK